MVKRFSKKAMVALIGAFFALFGVGGINSLLADQKKAEGVYYGVKPFYISLINAETGKAKLEPGFSLIAYYYDLSGHKGSETLFDICENDIRYDSLFFGCAPNWCLGLSLELVHFGSTVWMRTYETNFVEFGSYHCLYSVKSGSFIHQYTQSFWGSSRLTSQRFSDTILEKCDSSGDSLLFGKRCYANLKFSFYDHLTDPEKMEQIVLSSGICAQEKWRTIQNDFDQ